MLLSRIKEDETMLFEDGEITVSVDEALRVGGQIPFGCKIFVDALWAKKMHGKGGMVDLWTFYGITMALIAAGYIQGVRDERSKRRRKA